MILCLLLSAFIAYSPSSSAKKSVIPAQVSQQKFESGDTVYSLLKKFNFSDNQVHAALSTNVLPPGFILVPGQLFHVTRELNPTRLHIKIFDRIRDVTYSFWRDNQLAAGAQKDLQEFKTEKIRFTGRVRDSIIASIRGKIPDDQVVYRFLDAYQLDYNLTKVLQSGAFFSFVLEKKFIGKTFVRYGEIVETELEINNEIVRRRYFPTPRGGSFLNPQSPTQGKPLFAPVDYVHISSPFNKGRFHPVRKKRIAHLGIDFELPAGDPVFAALEGQVLRTGRNRAAGNFVVVRHPNGLESFYNHLSKIAANIRPGIAVETGTLVGSVGCTGYCTKPHLHFALKHRGRMVDPAPYVKSYSYNNRQYINKVVARSFSSRTSAL